MSSYSASLMTIFGEIIWGDFLNGIYETCIWNFFCFCAAVAWCDSVKIYIAIKQFASVNFMFILIIEMDELKVISLLKT